MLFQKRQDFIAQRTGLVVGQAFTQEITREFHIESIFIRLTAVVNGAIATATADGLLGLLKRVQFQISDGSKTRNVIDCSGRALIERAYLDIGVLDRNTQIAKDQTAAATYTITYPIFFASPKISDPVGSAFLLPAPRFNQNPILSLTIASQADVDGHATPTFTMSSLACDILVNKRQVNVVNFPTVDHELIETTVAYASSAASQLYELQVPGSYLSLALRGYTSATARGDVSTAGGEFKLQVLGNVIRRFKLLDVQTENDFSVMPQAATGAGSFFTGLYDLDFLTDRVGQDAGELGSVLDANVLAGLGARLQLLQDIAGGANVQVKYLAHRAFGDLSALKLAVPAGKA